MAGIVVLGCGGSGDRATARTPDGTPTAAAKSSAPSAVVAKPGLRLKKIGDFSSPVYVTAPRGDRRRIFVVEQGGTIRIVKDGKKLAQPFLDIASRISTGGERGLLSMAFAPGLRQERALLRLLHGQERRHPHRRVPPQERQPREPGVGPQDCCPSRTRRTTTTAGCCCSGRTSACTPASATVAAAGTSTGRAATARTSTRCSARSSASAIRAATASRRPEIYAYGLRNPWRYTFAPSGNMIIADVGQEEVEEVDFINKKGSNLGWRVWEGRRRYTPGETAPNAIFPVIQRFHSDGNCSITGGVVVRDPVLSALKGRYVFGDFCTGVVRVRPHQRPEARSTCARRH